MKRKIQVLFIFFLTAVSLNFFDATFLPKSFVQYTVFLTLAFSIALSVPYAFPKREGFVLPVQLIVLSILISIFMAAVSWGQSFRDSIIETASYSIWIFFFLLSALKLPFKILEKIILFYTGAYIVLYFYQFINNQTILFGWPLSEGDEFTEQRGIVRIVFPGAGIFILGIFMAVNKLTTQTKGKWFWLLLAVLGVIIPVLQVTRQFIAGVLLIYLLHLIRKQSIFKKAVITAFFIGILIYAGSSDNQIIKGVIETQQRDAKLGEDYIRVVAGTYFLNDFSPGFINQILGNGAPSWGVSDYGVFMRNLAERREFFLEDVGLIGMYAMFGILAVTGYILIWIKSFTIPLPKEYYYLKYYLWYLLLTSLTWYSVYHYSYLMSTVFVLYMYQMLYKMQKRQRKNRQDALKLKKQIDLGHQQLPGMYINNNNHSAAGVI